MKYKFYIFIIIFIFSFMFLFNFDLHKNISNDFHHIAIVEKTYNSSILVEENDEEYYLMGIEDDPYIKGDIIEYDTYYYEYNNSNSNQKNTFDIFYKSTKASAYGYPKNINIIKSQKNIRSNLYHNVYNSQGWYRDFSLIMLYGKTDENNQFIKEKIYEIGIPHLFIISGFHITIIYFIMSWFLSKIIRNISKIKFLSMIVSLFFLFLVYFPLTGVRSFLTLIISNYSNLNKIESLSLVGIIFLIFNPWMMFTSSMILSFSITFMIYFYQPKNNSFIDKVLIAIFAFYISLPTISTWENSHNIFAPFLSIILTPIISFIYIISIFALPFSFLWSILDVLFYFLWLIIFILSFLYLPMELCLIGFYEQIFLILISILFIYQFKEYKWFLLNNFFWISILLFLI
ncbi:MAG: hypothetical protein TYPL_2600 [Candidatus Tyloplasma litorale]|nr:MAG: hypothetical protein TYPL_2600 [Mycoplasmatales bacterium]